MDNSRRILEFKNIVKEFPGVMALDNVSFNCNIGDVIALMGENGAGKSTLMKILSGAYTRDSGSIVLEGKELPISYSTLEARKFGVAIIYQELSLLPELKVMENVYMSNEPKKIGNVIDFKKMEKDTVRQLEKLNASHINPNVKVRELSLPDRQMVEIAKALAVNCKVLIMDEPTTSLTHEEAEQLFEIIETLRKQDVTIIYISHRLDEIFSICNRAIVMRDGAITGEVEINKSTPDELIEMMSGKVLTKKLGKNRLKDIESLIPILELENISDGGFIENFNLKVYEGEVLGIGGLVGSKRTELARMICGIDPMKAGTIKINGNIKRINNTKQSIEAGIGYLSENRKDEGLSLGLSVEENTIHCDMKQISKNGIINWNKVRSISDNYIKVLKTKGKSNTKVVNLSGGNQQKVAIAKWLHSGCNILVFDEPTRGIDVNAKAEIHSLIREFVKEKNRAAIVISSDVNELVTVSDRIVTMSKGQITKIIDEDIEQKNVLKYITTKGR